MVLFIALVFASMSTSDRSEKHSGIASLKYVMPRPKSAITFENLLIPRANENMDDDPSKAVFSFLQDLLSFSEHKKYNEISSIIIRDYIKHFNKIHFPSKNAKITKQIQKCLEECNMLFEQTLDNIFKADSESELTLTSPIVNAKAELLYKLIRYIGIDLIQKNKVKSYDGINFVFKIVYSNLISKSKKHFFPKSGNGDESSENTSRKSYKSHNTADLDCRSSSSVLSREFRPLQLAELKSFLNFSTKIDNNQDFINYVRNMIKRICDHNATMLTPSQSIYDMAIFLQSYCEIVSFSIASTKPEKVNHRKVNTKIKKLESTIDCLNVYLYKFIGIGKKNSFSVVNKKWMHKENLQFWFTMHGHPYFNLERFYYFDIDSFETYYYNILLAEIKKQIKDGVSDDDISYRIDRTFEVFRAIVIFYESRHGIKLAKKDIGQVHALFTSWPNDNILTRSFVFEEDSDAIKVFNMKTIFKKVDPLRVITRRNSMAIEEIKELTMSNYSDEQENYSESNETSKKGAYESRAKQQELSEIHEENSLLEISHAQ